MCPNPQFPSNLVTFTEEILNGKLHFLCSVYPAGPSIKQQVFDGKLLILDTRPRAHIRAHSKINFCMNLFLWLPNMY